MKTITPKPQPPMPNHLQHRPTRTLQDRREVLLTLPRDLTEAEYTELRAIGIELESRGVLSIGIHF